MRKIVFMALLFCAGAAMALAAVEEVRFLSGSCENGKVWWTVVKYQYGRPCEVFGEDCNGINFQRDLNCMNVSADPTGGIYTHTGVGDNGVAWYARLRYDQQQRVTWLGGKDQNGFFYETEITYGDPGPGGLE